MKPRSLLRVPAVLLAVLVGTTVAAQTSAFAAPVPASPPTPSASSSLSQPRSQQAAVPDVVSSGRAMRVATVPASRPMRLTLGLAPSHPTEEAAFLAAVQDKRSTLFHQYLTPEEWNARFGPSAADEAAVVSWAQSQGLIVTQRFANRMVVDLQGDSATVAKAFGVKESTYQLGSSSFFANDTEPALPSSVSSAVVSIQGLSDFASLQPASDAPVPSMPAFSAGPAKSANAPWTADAKRKPTAAELGQLGVGKVSGQARVRKAPAHKASGVKPSMTGGSYDPTDVYSSQAYDTSALYAQGHCCNPTNVPGGGTPQTSIAIATAGTQNLNDMHGFQTAYPYLAYSVQQFNIDGTPTAPDGEGTMDMEWATAMSNSFGAFQNTSRVYMYNGANTLTSTFTDIFNHMLSDNLARVMTTSWGCAELSCYSGSTMTTDHNIFNAMIGQGWTLLAAAGDHGPYQDLSTVSVNYPASDPDVIAAGGTTLHLGSGPTFASETAWAGGPDGAASNDGGGGGGCSQFFARPSYQTATARCSTRSLPDLSLNADWFNTPQNMFFQGFLQGNGGTSIVAPELAGFFAQEDAYLLSLGHAPVGWALPQLYSIGAGAAPHDPYYDVTSGCTSNDIGAGWCAAAGYDLATGWGSVNMLQLAWALNWQVLPDAGAPFVTFSGPATGVWYNTDQSVSWTVTDTGSPASGVAGFSQGWDAVPSDPTTHAAPGAGDAFYDGPQFPNATSGYLALSWAGQGCHTAKVEAWDNMGLRSGVTSYGTLCYDTTLPTVTSAPAMSLTAGSQWAEGGGPVQVSWAAADTGSGVASYALSESVDGGAYTALSLTNPAANSQVLTLAGGHSYQFSVTAKDYAGNVSAVSTGVKHTLTVVQQNNSVVKFSAGWTNTAQTGALSGFVERATANGKTAKLTFSGTQVAWVTTLGSTHGSAKVKIGTAAATTVNTNATTTSTANLAYVETLAAGAHTLTITTSGSAGHPQVDVDAFVFIS
jgi:Pro-kumamolisin, activation domain